MSLHVSIPPGLLGEPGPEGYPPVGVVVWDGIPGPNAGPVGLPAGAYPLPEISVTLVKRCHIIIYTYFQNLNIYSTMLYFRTILPGTVPTGPAGLLGAPGKPLGVPVKPGPLGLVLGYPPGAGLLGRVGNALGPRLSLFIMISFYYLSNINIYIEKQMWEKVNVKHLLLTTRWSWNSRATWSAWVNTSCYRSM